MARRLTIRETRILALCIFVIFAYISYTFVFKLLRQKVTDLTNQAEALEQKLQKYSRVLKKKSQVEAEYDYYAADLKQTVSDEKVMTSIISEIGRVATSVDLRVVDLKPKRVKKVDFYNTFSVSLTVDGEFLTIVRFLHILQDAPHQFTIDDLRLDKGSIRSSKIKCRLSVSRFTIP